MNTDLTFITNEKNRNLLDRFQVLIKDTKFFDVLVGYFYSSGFYSLYKSLEKTEKIRILIGISTSRETYDLLKTTSKESQQSLQFSHAETKQEFQCLVEKELEDSEDNHKVEEGIVKFIEWVKSKKLEIRAYPSQNIHAKVYIMTFAEGDRDVGRIITGSSNFTQAGLVDNLELNVELKNRADYEFAKQKFEELWKDSVDVSEKCIQTIEEKTWLNPNITPYQLYLKFLYEYFKDELGEAQEVYRKYVPQDFMELLYQEQAVLNAKKILEEYGGVFVSDVVGTGKTYIATMLAGQLDGRTLVIAPPVLLDKNNPGSWPNVFSGFKEHADSESLGKLDDIIDRGTEKYKNIIIDEAHRFRTETNITYEKLAEICRGKRVILVTATPYNNSPKDILSQIKLFQKAKKSTIPNVPDLEGFFNGLEKKLNNLDRQRDYAEYIETVKENAKAIRERVLKYLMVRRTRTEIAKYFSEDLKKQGFKFPDVEKPEPLFYELNDEEDKTFNKTIELVAHKFKYARYTPFLPKYYKGETDQPTRLAQENMGKFMRILLVKRLESSFFAFKNSVDRFIYSYDMFIKQFEKGTVYVSKEYTNKIFELLENDDDEAIQRLIDEGKAEEYNSKAFRDDFIKDLKSDFDILNQVKALWQKVTRDPKLLKFVNELSKRQLLKQNKLIIFTESKETAEYLLTNLDKEFPNTTLCYTGGSSEATRDKVIENFDARARHPKDDYRILVSTEILSEGVNLHRSNVVINYDIPWNPTRLMQRVGRINRVDTKFDKIYTFNFFPTKQSNDQIKLKEVAIAKINAFLTLLGGDAALLTEGEPIGSHELFDRLVSKKTVTGEDETEESELKYLQMIKNIREKEPELFDKIKRLPRKARTAKQRDDTKGSLVTYFRRGKLQKFFMAQSVKDSQELDFLTAAKLLESGPEDKKQKLPEKYYELLDKNKEAFIFATTEEMVEPQPRRGRDSAFNVLKILKATMKNTQQLTDEQELYLKKVITQLEEGGLPKQTSKETLKALNRLKQDLKNPLKVLATLQTHIPVRLLEGHYAEQIPTVLGKREVILSLYLTGE
ncbi:MAG: phospholipase D-like domain-containing protein [candidate division Zixibacteria bacterium]|nr:phospholipase D-like domain-containing protein [candidate division Zixibacteria bacterium]